jgi:hypothetical protein
MYNYCASNTSVRSPRSVSAPSCTPSCFQGLPKTNIPPRSCRASSPPPVPVYWAVAALLSRNINAALLRSPQGTTGGYHRLTCVMNISNQLIGGLLYFITTWIGGGIGKGKRDPGRSNPGNGRVTFFATSASRPSFNSSAKHHLPQASSQRKIQFPLAAIELRAKACYNNPNKMQ